VSTGQRTTGQEAAPAQADPPIHRKLSTNVGEGARQALYVLAVAALMGALVLGITRG
jgi:hypothetical protein